MNISEWWFIKEKRYEFYERAGLYLLWAFIASILLNPFIMLYYGREKMNYVVVENQYSDFNLVGLDAHQQELIDKYGIASNRDIAHYEDFSSRINWIGFISILGWVCTSPGVHRRFSKLWVDSGLDKYI